MLVKISAIIVNYNAGSFLAESVTSIFNSSVNVNVEVIVVDNASTDNSLELLSVSYAGKPNLQVIMNPKNYGFSRACNIGALASSGEYLLFLNPDSVMEPSALAILSDILSQNPDVGMVGGLILNPNGSEQAGGRRAVPTPWRSFVRATGLYRLKDRYPRLFSDFVLHKMRLPDYPIEVESISGSCMMVRRIEYNDVGPLDEDYFMHCEDLDWCMRFRKKGWKILFVPDARIVHHKGVCSRPRPIFVEWNKHRGMIHFYRKFFRHQYPGILMWIVTLGVWIRFGLIASFYLLKHRVRS